MSFLTFILGREPHVSVAEIAAVIGDGAEWARAELSAEVLTLPPPRHFEGTAREISHDGTPSNGARSLAVLEMAEKIISRLGGTVKIGEVWRTVTRGKASEVDAGGKTSGVDRKTPDVEERVHEAIGRYILDATTADRKVHFGYSVYDLGGGAVRVREVRESLRRGAAAQKAWLTEHGRKVRWVTSRESTLSSVVIAKNDLLPERNGVEVLVLVSADRILLARTLAVQPFEEWSHRDYGRPSRDARSGMLPPKLARAMINIALARSSKLEARNSKQARNPGVEVSKFGHSSFRFVSDFGFRNSDFTLLDPFCGSGTILTEAMALGIPRIIGTDVSAEAVENAKANVAWTQGQRSFSPSREGERLVPRSLGGVGEGEGSVCVQRCDVHRLSQCIRERVDAIVTESYLGPPIGQQGSMAAGQHGELIAELRTLYLAAFREFAKALKPGGRVVFITPTLRSNHSPIRTNRRMVQGEVHREGGREIVLDITRDVEPLGFHRIKPFPAPLHDHPILHGKADLPYARPDQRVGRRILVFEFRGTSPRTMRLSRKSRS